jgi:hypothetical protein
MENIFSNLVDIAKITNVNNISPNINSNKPVINTDDSSHNIINLNTLLLNETNTHTSHTTNTPPTDINLIMTHINELNEKIIYYNNLAILKEKENEILINDNRILKTNLDMLKKRLNIK